MKTAIITQSRGVFSMTCRVALNIHAPAARLWSLLTDLKGFPRWNSTVTRVDGQIREGERLRLHVPGTDRTFTPRVSGVVREVRLRRWMRSPRVRSEVFAVSPRGSRPGWLTLEAGFLEG